MLHSLLRYARQLSFDARWLVIDGTPGFFHITKRIHNALHGSRGDGTPLGRDERALFEAVSQSNTAALQTLVQPRDIVVCHDPQTAGLIPALLRRGALVIWRCHIGHEQHESIEVERGWQFLRPYIEEVPLAVFSRAAYAPSWVRGKRTMVIPPNIDPFSAKNLSMTPEAARAILSFVGLIDKSADDDGAPEFMRDDASVSRMARKADMLRVGQPPAADTPLVVQVSRWDAMKDPLGVLHGFTRLITHGPTVQAELVLAGPGTRAVTDDPEGAQVFGELQQAYLALPEAQRRRVHLALLPMDDIEENAAIVNALQRHAHVIVQKSLVEGFGLTVTEALWKGRPVIASAVGGILDQIRDGTDGLLLHDPSDLGAFAALMRRVLDDPSLARRLGQAGYERVRDHFLSISALELWAGLLEQLTEHEQRSLSHRAAP
jgi:trehalose synthase